MKKTFFSLFTLLLLMGCSSAELSFSPSSALSLDEQHVSLNRSTNIAFPLNHDIIMCNYTGDSGSKFITYQNFSAQYPAYRLIRDSMKQLPFKCPLIDFVFSDKCIVLRVDNDYSHWQPNCVFNTEGEQYIEQTSYKSTTKPLEKGECWRNIIVSQSQRRILCIDRILLKGHHYAIVYILQAEHKCYPYQAVYHWDITKTELLPYSGETLNALYNVTKAIIDANV